MCRGVGADFEKTENIFSAHNEQGNMKHGEKWFPTNYKKIDNIILRYGLVHLKVRKNGNAGKQLF